VSPVRASRRATRGALAVGLLTAVHLVSAAQAPPTPPGAPTFETVSLTAGRSVVLATEFDIVRVAVTNPAVADATVVMPREVLVDGKAPGTISLILWGTSVRKQYDVVVDPGVPTLQQQLSAFFPGENIRVSLNEESLASVAALRVEMATWRARPSRRMTRASDDPIRPIPTSAIFSNIGAVIFSNFSETSKERQ